MTKTPITSKTIRVPAAVFSAKSTKSADRFQDFVKLVSICAQTGGVYQRKDTPVRLRAGQVITTLDELGVLWGDTRYTARRTLGAFERDGLLTTKNAEDEPELRIEGIDARLKGTLVTLIDFKDDPRLVTVKQE